MGNTGAGNHSGSKPPPYHPTGEPRGYAPVTGKPSPDGWTRFRTWGEGKIRETASDRLVSIQTNGSMWLDLARQVSIAAALGSPAHLVGAGVTVLGTLAGLDSEEARLLQSIERKVELLRARPFLLGRDLIAEASRAPSPDGARSLLEEALMQFREARHLVLNPIESGVVEAHLGYVQFLLDNRSEAQHWLAAAHDRLTKQAATLVETAGDVQVLKSRTSTGAAAYFYPAGVVVLVKKIKKVREAERARLTLVELQPVVTALSQSVRALGGAELEAYELDTADGQWSLQPMLPPSP